LLLIIDGLDEKLVHYDKEQQDKFLKELISAISPEQSPQSKTILSCRNHYFETALKQNNFLLGKGRVGTKSSHYVALDILPLDKDEVEAFLSKQLSKEETVKVLAYISNDEYLGSIASRPFMLSKILELLPYLSKQKERGEKLNIASFYDALVTDTFARDEEKNKIDPYDKAYILQKLSYFMYQNSTQSISIHELNKWFLKLIREDENLAEYKEEEKELLKQDLRNSTLLVRFGEEDFGFSHSSIYEYFLARYALENWEVISRQKMLSTLTGQFLVDSIVNLKEQVKIKLLPKLINSVGRDGSYWIKLSLDLLSVLGLEITKLEINNMDLINYKFKNLKINYLNISDCMLRDVHFINCKIQNFKVKNTDFSDSYFEDTNFIDMNESKCNWKDVTLLNSNLNLDDIEHDYRKIIKDKIFFSTFFFNISSDSVMSIALSPNSEYIISASIDRGIKLWNIKGECLASLVGYNSSIRSVNFSPNGETIISSSDYNTVKLWSLKGEVLSVFKGHKDYVRSVSFSPNGESIISGSNDNTVKLWNLKGKCLVTFEGHISSVSSISFNPNGEYIVSSSDDKTLKLWNLQAKCLVTFKGHTSSVRSVSFSPNGDTIVSASKDNTVKLWNLEGKCLITLEGHISSVNSVCFSPNGESILSGSADRTLKIWNLKGECILTCKGHNRSISSVCFSLNGESVISGSIDGTTRLWNIKRGRESVRYVHQDKEWCSLDFQNQTAKGTPMSWKISTLTDEEGEEFTIDKLKGFEVYRY
jgi:WD40 repeat protein